MSETLSRGLAVSIGLVVGFLVLDAWLTYRNTRQLDEDARLVAHTHQVLDALDDVLSTLKDAETGQRGFLLTGDGRYLEPYRAAIPTVDRKVDRVAELTAADAARQARLPELRRHVADKVTELEAVLR